MDENKIIIVTHGLKKRIMKELDASYPTIRTALAFKTHSVKARLIRKFALENGGKLMEKPEEQLQI